MFWVILIIAALIIAAGLESTLGKIIIGCGVIALGFMLISWITGISFLVSIAKAFVVIIIIVIVVQVLMNIFEK